MDTKLSDYKDLKLKLDGLVPPGHGFHRNLLFDTLYASLPRDPPYGSCVRIFVRYARP